MGRGAGRFQGSMLYTVTVLHMMIQACCSTLDTHPGCCPVHRFQVTVLEYTLLHDELIAIHQTNPQDSKTNNCYGSIQDGCMCELRIVLAGKCIRGNACTVHCI